MTASTSRQAALNCGSPGRHTACAARRKLPDDQIWAACSRSTAVCSAAARRTPVSPRNDVAHATPRPTRTPSLMICGAGGCTTPAPGATAACATTEKCASPTCTPVPPTHARRRSRRSIRRRAAVPIVRGAVWSPNADLGRARRPRPSTADRAGGTPRSPNPASPGCPTPTAAARDRRHPTATAATTIPQTRRCAALPTPRQGSAPTSGSPGSRTAPVTSAPTDGPRCCRTARADPTGG